MNAEDVQSGASQSCAAPQQSNFVPGMVAAGLHSLVFKVFKDLSRHSRSRYMSTITPWLQNWPVIREWTLLWEGRIECNVPLMLYSTTLVRHTIASTKKLFNSSPVVFTKIIGNKRKNKCACQKTRKRGKKSIFIKHRMWPGLWPFNWVPGHGW